MANGPIAAEELRLLIERVERLEEEKKGISDDIKDVYLEAKARGFDAKTMRAIVKLRKLTADERREQEAMLDLYRAALGMLDGTPLGNWAVEKLKKDEPKPEEQPEGEAAASSEQEPEAEAPPALTVEDAQRMGSEAARAGEPVTANPFPPRDPCRAAWDEAWCKELGSDGMDIPSALKPTPKAKPESKEPPASPAPKPAGKKK